MNIQHVTTTPIAGMKPGTSGLRKRVTEFARGHYLANFVQSVFNAVRPDAGFGGLTLVVGGDGRYHNREAIQAVVRMAAANGFGRLLVGRDGILSTPAASCVIRKHAAFGGLILSASHNPGGPEGDFGIKFNAANGGPAPEKITDAIYAQTLSIAEFLVVDAPDIDLGREATHHVGDLVVEVIDPVADYVALMRQLFDFDALRALFAGGFRLAFDAMHAVTGPYAHAIFERELGAAAGTVRNGTPRPDFGGHHPDPNLVHAKDLLDLMMGPRCPRPGRRLRRRRRPQPDHRPRPVRRAVGLAGDAGRQRPPGARLPQGHRRRRALDAHQRRGRPGGGPDRRAVLRDADRLEILRQPARRRPHHAVRRRKRGHGSRPRAREGRRLGRAAVASILAARRQSVQEVARTHWAGYGRNYYTRHDYEDLDTPTAQALMSALERRLGSLAAERPGGRVVALADDFSYTDPVDGSVSAHQGLRIVFDDGSRIVFRLSGTGTSGSTLRVYIESYEPDPARHAQDTQHALAGLIALADEIAQIRARTGRRQPDVIT